VVIRPGDTSTIPSFRSGFHLRIRCRAVGPGAAPRPAQARGSPSRPSRPASGLRALAQSTWRSPRGGGGSLEGRETARSRASRRGGRDRGPRVGRSKGRHGAVRKAPRLAGPGETHPAESLGAGPGDSHLSEGAAAGPGRAVCGVMHIRSAYTRTPSATRNLICLPRPPQRDPGAGSAARPVPPDGRTAETPNRRTTGPQ
jgi:hypothetical protein